MYLLLLGLSLLLLKGFDVAPIAAWDWWWVLAPFALTALWWWWADRSGYTKRRENEKMDQRRERRIEAGRKRLGLPPLRKRP